ncbi:MAG TPA: hypothetical protein VK911_00475 [Vicinamibacterales bacterium]|nr:hypothetical protein [Vicinamibacterales bacterium]
MKKLGIGCLVVLVLFAIVGVIAGYLVYDRLYKPAAEYVGSFKELGAIADLEREVKNTASFREPAGGELSEELVQRFMSVQDSMKARLGSRLDRLKAKYDEIEEGSGEGQASFSEAMGALKDLTAILVEAKRAQVDALNAAGFSVKEYEWVRNQVYAGLGIIAGGLDLKNLAQAAGEGGQQLRARLDEVPERNRELIARYEQKLRDLAPLAFFGF